MTTLEVDGLTVRYGAGSTLLTAVDDVDLAIPPGATLGLVGESGCGKSTVARAIVRLVPITSGRVLLDGKDIAGATGDRLHDLRRRVQMVFQDPHGSLNPRMTVGETIGEAITTHRRVSARSRALEVARLVEMVGLNPGVVTRYPHQFSGGQRQRIAIARSLAVGPEILICDEVTSSVDVSVQANILNLLRELQKKLGLSYLFISHNLSVIRYMSDVVAVMYLGKVVERAPVGDLFARPRHPYTRALIDSIPRAVSRLARDRVRLSGDLPDPRYPPAGCRFHTRCPFGPVVHPDRVICRDIDPHTMLLPGPHVAACHFPLAGDGVGAGTTPQAP